MSAIRQGLFGMVGALFFAAATLTFVALEGAGLRDDLAVRDAARPVAGLRLVEGHCRGRLMLLQTCDVTLAWSGKEGSGTRRVSYTFVEPGMGAWSARPVADPARLHLVTTDLGLERLTNRIVTLAGIALAGLALAAGAGLAALRAVRGLRGGAAGRSA
jgi:hypothetical protein